MKYYIRTKYGIAKIDHCVITKRFDIKKGTMEDYEYIVTDSWIFPDYEEKTNECFEEDIIKLSPNIIDLIEKGDYVNDEKITRVILEDICGDEILDSQHIFVRDKEIYNDQIKSIVTKEQFEEMKYKVGDKDE